MYSKQWNHIAGLSFCLNTFPKDLYMIRNITKTAINVSMLLFLHLN